MRVFQFTREAKYVQYGFVTANSKEEALQLIKDGKEDDIYDTDEIESYNETIKIDEGKEEE